MTTPQFGQILNVSDTQLAHAQRLMDRSPTLRYVKGVGWLHFDGARWTAEGAEIAVNRAVHEAARDAHLMSASSFTAGLNTRRGLDDVEAIARNLGTVRVDARDLDRNPDWLHANGITWDLRTGNAWPTALDELNTKATNAEPADACPSWLQFLTDAFPRDPEMPAYLKRLVGYGITGHTREQAFVLLHGRGANGKSTFIDALTHAFRAYTQHIPIEVLMSGAQRSGEAPSPMLMLMRGARLVFTAESDRGGRLNESMVKLLTGGDEITARNLNSAPVTFRPQALIMMATNHMPTIQGTDDGIWRRIKLIEWRESFLGREDKGIADRLRAEAPGIVNWAIEGAAEWYETGLATPHRVTTSTQGYRADQDFLGEFVGEWVALDETSWLPNGEIKAAFDDFCAANGRDSVKNPSTLYAAMRERGARKVTRRGREGHTVRRLQ